MAGTFGFGKAAGAEGGRFTGQGTFTQPGMPEAVANAPARCYGFGSPIDDEQWQAASVTHDVLPEKGWSTIIETEVKAN